MMKVLEERKFPVNGTDTGRFREKSLARKYNLTAKPARSWVMKRPFPQPDVALFSAGEVLRLNWRLSLRAWHHGHRQFIGLADGSFQKAGRSRNQCEGITKQDKIIANPNCSTIQMVWC
jgi:aspartate-semialdehyde dehydrogenase